MQLQVVFAVVSLFLISLSVRADTLLSGDYGDSGIFNDTVGFSFTLKDSPLRVTSLGVYDAGTNGLSRTNFVGLWDNSGSLLASVTINRSTNAPLVGFFRWADLSSPITLSASNTYRIGAQANIGETRYSGAIPQGLFSGTSETTNVFFDGAVRNNAANVFSFPNSAPQAGIAVIGPNATFEVVPEPSTFALLLMTAAGALFWVKRRA